MHTSRVPHNARQQDGKGIRQSLFGPYFDVFVRKYSINGNARIPYHVIDLKQQS